MKPKFISALVLSVLAFCLNVSAQTVSPEAARAKATDFFSTGARNLPAKKGVKRQAPAVGNIELAYTSEKDGKTCFYVFNNGDDGGFVIVGGDEAAKEILAFSDHGHFDYDEAPDNFKNMLEQYAEQISLAKPVEQKRMAKAPATIVPKEDIADLIETTWDQGDPYNRAIPKLVNSNTGEEFAPPTGCVHTAVAQVMKYWNYPEHGFGQIRTVHDYSNINGYNPGLDSFTPEFGTIIHEVNFAETTYDWANMLNNYTGQETEKQINAVSTLMYHVGLACHAVYGVNETPGADPVGGLKDYFGYSPKAIEINRGKFDDDIWEDIIYTELTKNRPVLYSGFQGGSVVGHQFIVHGYSSQYDMYKVNWGWGGMDCYCKLTPLPDSGSTLLGFENNQEAVIRLQPATMDSNSSLEYGDTFWNNGIKYSIISSVFNFVEVARPERDETQYAGSIVIPATVNHKGKIFSVIGLGKECFALMSNIDENGNEWCSPLDSPIDAVNLPDGLRYIGGDAFKDCGNLKQIEIPNSVTKLVGLDSSFGIFNSCYNLKNVTLPNNITEIPSRCFLHCKNLEKIDVPEGVTTISSEAFSWCENLSLINLPSTLNLIDNYAFQRCNNLDVLICKATTPPTINSSYESPFTASASSGYLLVPEESINLYKKAQYWKDWKNILPIGAVDITTIGKTVTIDNFEYKLLPEGAEVIKVLISWVPQIAVPDIISVNGSEYKVTSLGSNLSFYCDEVILPQYLTTIKAHAFQYSWAKEIKIPTSVTSIGNYAFEYCRNLEKVILPDDIKEIPEDCFSGCDNLYMVVLPQNVAKISYGAIRRCPNLFTIICRAEGVPEWDNRLQNYYNSVEATLYVPSSSVEAYRSSDYWKEFRFIKPIDDFDDSKNLVTVNQNELNYRILEHGAVVIGHPETITEETVTIPENLEHDGKSYPVVSIGASALSDQSAITTVHLPSSLHSILGFSFDGCRELKNIDLPDDIEFIGEYAFNNCTNLSQIHIPHSLKILGISFPNTAIEKLIIPEGVESVERAGGSTFGSMTSLKEIVIPSSADMIRTYGYSISINPNTEKVYVLAPNKINGTISGNNRQATAYVPSEYLEQYRHENDPDNFFGRWYFKEVLPIIPLTSIVLNENNVVITSGETKTIAADFSPVDASLKYMKWSSSDPTIASVDYKGIITAHKAGSVIITATSMYYPDVAASCTVTVSSNVGDANGDGKVTLADVTPLLSYLLTGNASEVNLGNSDVNGDGVVSIGDITALIKKLQDVNQ